VRGNPVIARSASDEAISPSVTLGLLRSARNDTTATSVITSTAGAWQSHQPSPITHHPSTITHHASTQSPPNPSALC